MKQSIPVYQNATDKMLELGKMYGRLAKLEEEVERLKERIALVAAIQITGGYDDVN